MVNKNDVVEFTNKDKYIVVETIDYNDDIYILLALLNDTENQVLEDNFIVRDVSTSTDLAFETVEDEKFYNMLVNVFERKLDLK